jgi:hypothetical protein
MKRFVPALALLFLVVLFHLPALVTSQTRERTVGPTRAESEIKAEVIKTDVDLVTVDALVLQKNTSRIVGNLAREDFTISEDGVAKSISHFSQDRLPLSVLLLIDRGGCLDPFGEEVRHAALSALDQLKPVDEVAVMTYHDTVDLMQGFTSDRRAIRRALDYVPPHDERANHCLDTAFDEAANYMSQAANPGTFRTLIEHLRTRYTMASVSSNKNRDGTLRKLKIELAPATSKTQKNLVIKARRSYIAPKS